MPFQQGQSGNPAGRPKTAKAITDALRYIGKQPYTGEKIRLPRNPTVAQLIAKTLYERALAGEVAAFHIIANRVDGKVERARPCIVDKPFPAPPSEESMRELAQQLATLLLKEHPLENPGP